MLNPLFRVPQYFFSLRCGGQFENSKIETMYRSMANWRENDVIKEYNLMEDVKGVS